MLYSFALRRTELALRYDAAIIGAGANGLTAAAVLTRAGLKTVVIERGAAAGGRLVTDTFHPGFSASAFADRAPEIPAEVSAALTLDPPLLIERLPAMCGRETFTMVVSSTSMNAPSVTMTATSHGLDFRFHCFCVPLIAR